MLADSKYAVHSTREGQTVEVSTPHDVRFMSAKRECRLLQAFLTHVRIRIHIHIHPPPPQKTLSSSLSSSLFQFRVGTCYILILGDSMTENYANASASSSSSLNSSSQDTEDDHTIATILAEQENLKYDGKLGKRLSHLDSIPHTPRVNGEIPDVNDATLDHERLSARPTTYSLAELRIEGDGNCQFRALADQLFRNPDYHKHVRKEVVKQLKHFRKLYEGYVPMKYKSYLKKMKKLGEWGDHVTLQAAADRFGAKICLVTSFRDTCYVEILPKDKNPSRELWLSFWSEVHYNSLYEGGEVPTRVPKKKHWLVSSFQRPTM